MGIDIYTTWKGQTEYEKDAQMVGFGVDCGHVGYLREAYHGKPYATKRLLKEVFSSPNGQAKISSVLLRKRLPETLALVRKRELIVHSESNEYSIFRVMKSFVDFVDLCQWKQFDTGEPVTIIAIY